MINNNQFSETEINQLKEYRDKCLNNRLKERFIALIIFATLSVSKIQLAEIMGKSKKTIENWLSIYYAEGIEGLDNFKYKHKKSFSNFYQKNQVKIFVSFNNPETVKEVSDYIEKKLATDTRRDI
jgi:transposase